MIQYLGECRVCDQGGIMLISEWTPEQHKTSAVCYDAKCCFCGLQTRLFYSLEKLVLYWQGDDYGTWSDREFLR